MLSLGTPPLFSPSIILFPCFDNRQLLTFNVLFQFNWEIKCNYWICYMLPFSYISGLKSSLKQVQLCHHYWGQRY